MKFGAGLDGMNRLPAAAPLDNANPAIPEGHSSVSGDRCGAPGADRTEPS
jgi:hypothetical protein